MSRTPLPPARQSDYVPVDNADLFAHFYPLITRLVANTPGIEGQDVENVAMTLVEKIVEKDVLSDYNPNFTSSHDGVTRPAAFATFLSGFVLAYVRYYGQRQRLRAKREGFSIYSEVGHSSAQWIDLFGPSIEDEHDDLDVADLIAAIHAHLIALPPNRRARVSLDDLFAAIVEQVLVANGRMDVPALARLFAVSQNTIRNWVHRLREEIMVVRAAQGRVIS